MAESNGYRPTSRRLKPARMANLVADELRRRIVDGELADGDLLPRQQLLVDEFKVSYPSLREAMRFLETEGLVSVRRGNVGGAVVHAPKTEAVAYMLALIVRAQGGRLSELALALRELEPVCAAIASANPDRRQTLVPVLRRLNEEMELRIDDPDEFTTIGREFHESLVSGCGNVLLKVVVGTLASLWSDYEISWAEAKTVEGEYPSIAERKTVLKAHMRLTELINEGDRQKAYELAHRHSAGEQSYVLHDVEDEVISIPVARRIT